MGAARLAKPQWTAAQLTVCYRLNMFAAILRVNLYANLPINTCALSFTAAISGTGESVKSHALSQFLCLSFTHKHTHRWMSGRYISLPFLHLIPSQSCPPPSHFYPLFSPPPSSISLFSTLLHWSLFKLISVLFPPSFPLRFPASWLMEDIFQCHNQSETWVNIDQKP